VCVSTVMTTNLFPRVGSLMDNKLVLFIFLLFSVPHRTNSDSALHTSAMNQNPQDPFGLNQQMGRGPPQRNGESNTHTHHKLLQGRRFCWFPLLPLTRPRCRPVPFTRVLVEGNTTPLRRSLPVFHWISSRSCCRLLTFTRGYPGNARLPLAPPVDKRGIVYKHQIPFLEKTHFTAADDGH